MRLRLLIAAIALAALLVTAAGCASRPVPPGARPSASMRATLPPESSGIAFVRDGRTYVIRHGAAAEVARDGNRKLAVGYSADGEMLLITEQRLGRVVALMVPARAGADGREILASSDGSALGAVRAIPEKGVVYRSAYGAPECQLLVSQMGADSQGHGVPLEGTFSGEFDVGAAGEIVYTGAGQNPATLMLVARGSSRPLATGMATAFAPAFARNGARVCFTGSERAQDPLGLWTVDLTSGAAHYVEGSQRVRPTFPVFSPDGTKIAVRSAADGSIWVFPLEGGHGLRLDLRTDDAPIGW
jgi:hypothetical protein